MNKKQAETEGLRFTGIYQRDKEEVKQQIVKERLERPGSRILLVIIPDSKYSRGGGGTGYSVYADNVYFAYDRVRCNNNIIEAYPLVIKKLKEDCDLACTDRFMRYSKAIEDLKQAQELISKKEE